jgi:hypothetical protein
MFADGKISGIIELRGGFGFTLRIRGTSKAEMIIHSKAIRLYTTLEGG